MKVKDVMTGDAVSCRAQDDLGRVAKLLWDRDCGSVPVVDASDRVVGMVTDRDVCMAAFMRAEPLTQLRVENHMSRPVRTCAAGDSVEDAARRMGELQVRRLPILADDGSLCGILSINDLIRAANASPARTQRALSTLLLEVLGQISRPRVEPEGTVEVTPAAKPTVTPKDTGKKPAAKTKRASAKKKKTSREK